MCTMIGFIQYATYAVQTHTNDESAMGRKGAPFPHIQFITQGVPRLTCPKDAGEQYGER